MPVPGLLPPAPRSVGEESNSMLENASTEELSILVLAIQDEYAKLSQDKAIADDTIVNLNRQYKDAMDEICSLSSKMKNLEHENEEVRSMIETRLAAGEVASDRALAESEAATNAMRDALVAEIGRLTAEMSKYAKEADELAEEKEAVEEENKKMHEELTIARRDAERARLDRMISNEEASNKLHKFDIERNVVDQQKVQIDELESELEGQREDSEAAARSYEAAISELKSRLESSQSGAAKHSESIRLERDNLLGEKEELADRADRAEGTVFDMEWNIVDQQKVQMDELECNLDGWEVVNVH